MGKLFDAELGETADRILRERYAEQQRIRDAIARNEDDREADIRDVSQPEA